MGNSRSKRDTGSGGSAACPSCPRRSTTSASRLITAPSRLSPPPPRDLAPQEQLAGAIARPHQRPAGHVAEAMPPPHLLVGPEPLRGHELHHRKVPGRGA